MKYTVGNIGVASPISVNTGAPTDCRYVVRNKSAIIGTTEIDGKMVDNYKLTFKSGAAYTYYEGMQVFVEGDQVYILKYTRDETGKVTKTGFEPLTSGATISQNDVLDILQTNNYINQSTLTTTLNNYVTQDNLSGQLTGLYKIKGVLDDIKYLPNNASVGDVYNIRDRFTIEVTLEDGSKSVRSYPAGTNVVWIEYEVSQ